MPDRVTVEQVMECVIPPDYFTGDQEPEGHILGIRQYPGGNLDEENKRPAKNLRTLFDVRARLSDLGLPKIREKQIAVTAQSIVANIFIGRVVV